ncbi:glycoside hydrolase family 2 TIM barrel-domain containing protein [Sphingomonas sp. LR61]
MNQGYWPDSHIAAPSRGALRREVELIKELGFNAARNHQKIEDPRFLYWADRLGILVWGEAPGAYAFSPRAVQRLMREWMDAVERDASHPSIVTWVPANESWGVQHISTDPAQQAYARSLADVTRAIDPTRPVISNDGWEHTNSDIVTIHDYEGAGDALARTYADDAARTALFTHFGPSDRWVLVGGAQDLGQPVMLTEFGGVNYQPGAQREDGWGYTSATDGDDWVTRITALYDAIRASLVPGRLLLHAADRHHAGDERPAQRRPLPEGPDRADPSRGHRSLAGRPALREQQWSGPVDGPDHRCSP